MLGRIPYCPRHVWLVIAIGTCVPLVRATPAAGGTIDFERNVWPILREHCHACHGPQTQEAGLRLDRPSAALSGGDHGPVVRAGSRQQSQLYQRITSTDADERMPPARAALSAQQVETLGVWIDEGAVWPPNLPEPAATSADQTDRRSTHWAFQPPRDVPLPARPVARAVDRGEVDDAPIDRFLLAALNRAGLDLSPPADRRTLLRRVCLDLVGIPPTPEEMSAFLADASPMAYERAVDRLLASPRYGERWAQHWLDVIRYGDTHGFEVNTPRDAAWPYRDYVIDAFNRDLSYDRFVAEQLCGDQLDADEATGFLVAAAALLPGQIGADDESKRQARQDELDEVITGTANTLLGLSLGCARCHDHKFDPLTQRDYYSMQAFFAGLDYGERPLHHATALHPAGRDMAQATAFAGIFRAPDATYLLRRGNPEQRIQEIEPNLPAVFQPPFDTPPTQESARRQALAAWITAPTNPLTARVLVNRLWLYHFGRGIVTTPNDLGLNGAPPSHPELLDWLANELIRSHWSIKHLQRLIVTSRAYRQSAVRQAAGERLDHDNRWLWRYPARRLEAEAIRDSVLAVSGELNLSMGGPGFNFFQSRGGLNGFPPVETFGPAELRRMVYAHKVRMERVPVFGAFDCPDAGQSAPQRGRSTTAIQALNLLNSPFLLEQATRLSERSQRAAGDDVQQQVVRTFWNVLQRPPDDAERQYATDVVNQAGLPALCRALLNTNEFVYLP